jgi:multisubunit Na+/H+ antiporter MnhC subunit
MRELLPHAVSNGSKQRLAFSIFGILTASTIAHAAKIGKISETSWTEQALDFLSLEQPVVRTAVLGTLVIGFCCGVLGSFLVVRKLSLLGEADV